LCIAGEIEKTKKIRGAAPTEWDLKRAVTKDLNDRHKAHRDRRGRKLKSVPPPVDEMTASSLESHRQHIDQTLVWRELGAFVLTDIEFRREDKKLLLFFDLVRNDFKQTKVAMKYDMDPATVCRLVKKWQQKMGKAGLQRAAARLGGFHTALSGPTTNDAVVRVNLGRIPTRLLPPELLRPQQVTPTATRLLLIAVSVALATGLGVYFWPPNPPGVEAPSRVHPPVSSAPERTTPKSREGLGRNSRSDTLEHASSAPVAREESDREPRIRSAPMASARAEAGEQREAKAAVGRQIGLLEQRLSKLLDMRLDGHIDEAVYDQKRVALEREVRLLRERQASLAAGQGLLEPVNRQISFGNLAKSAFMAANLTQKRALLRGAFSNLVLMGKKLVVMPREPFSFFAKTEGTPTRLRLLDAFRTENWRTVEQELQFSGVLNYA
jgi:hypothetical protein